MLFVPICYSHHRKQIHPASIYPFWARIHAMPGGKAVIVFKATRPTASCLQRWVRTPGERMKKAWIKQQEMVQQHAKLEKASPGWAETEKPKGDWKVLWDQSVGGCVCVFFQSQRKSTHCFYLEGNQGTSDGYRSHVLWISGHKCRPFPCLPLWVINPPIAVSGSSMTYSK